MFGLNLSNITLKNKREHGCTTDRLLKQPYSHSLQDASFWNARRQNLTASTSFAGGHLVEEKVALVEAQLSSQLFLVHGTFRVVEVWLCTMN